MPGQVTLPCTAPKMIALLIELQYAPARANAVLDLHASQLLVQPIADDPERPLQVTLTVPAGAGGDADAPAQLTARYDPGGDAYRALADAMGAACGLTAAVMAGTLLAAGALSLSSGGANTPLHKQPGVDAAPHLAGKVAAAPWAANALLLAWRCRSTFCVSIGRERGAQVAENAAD